MLQPKRKKYYSIQQSYLLSIYNTEINVSNKGAGCTNINLFNTETFYINGLTLPHDIHLHYATGISPYHYFKTISAFIN